MRVAPRLLEPIIRFALPPRCPACGEIVDGDGNFCLDCWEQLEFIAPPWCDGCGMPFAHSRPEGMLCADCLADPPVHDGVRAVTVYGDVSRQIPMRLKYGRKTGLAGMIAAHMRRFADQLPEDTILIPVPLHRWRLWSRGFNQSALIATELGKLSGRSVINDALLRGRSTPPLRGMSAKERARTVRGAFAVRPERKAALKDAHVALIDDVFTSGSTAHACTKLLKANGANNVTILCWARVVHGID